VVVKERDEMEQGGAEREEKEERKGENQVLLRLAMAPEVYWGRY
jgi:hypothetical protein